MPTIQIMFRLGHTNIETTMNYFQDLGCTDLKNINEEPPAYLSDPSKQDIEEAEEFEREQDRKHAEWLTKKVGLELAQAIVFGSGMDEEDIKKPFGKGYTSCLEC